LPDMEDVDLWPKLAQTKRKEMQFACF
jgi:hypothetical protein